jgi:anthranilate phosphoribosyltransferase
MAEALALLDVELAWVVHSDEGLDELSPSGLSSVFEVRAGSISLLRVAPEDAGIARQALAALNGGGAAENSARIEALLSGQSGEGSAALLLNAAACAVIAGIAADLGQGAALARSALAGGHGLMALQRLREVSHAAVEVAQ